MDYKQNYTLGMKIKKIDLSNKTYVAGMNVYYTDHLFK